MGITTWVRQEQPSKQYTSSVVRLLGSDTLESIVQFLYAYSSTCSTPSHSVAEASDRQPSNAAAPT